MTINQPQNTSRRLAHGESYPIIPGTRVAHDALPARDTDAGNNPGQELLQWVNARLSSEDAAEFEMMFEHFLDKTNTNPDKLVTAMDSELRKLASSVRPGNPAAVARYVALSKARTAQADAASFNARYPGAARIRVLG